MQHYTQRFLDWLDASAYNFDTRKEARQKYLALYKENPETIDRLIPNIVEAEIQCFGNGISVLHSRGHAPGSYSATCHVCTKDFIGDKRAFTCLNCAQENV